MTFSFNHIGNHGHLGNQMFQYAATKSLAIKHNRDFMIAPKTTARFGAGLGTQGSDLFAGVTYRPDRKTFVEGRAMTDSMRGPEYRVSFGRRFAQGGIASL